MKKKYKILYTTKKPNKELVEKIEVFTDFGQACNFVRTVNSVTTPIIEEVK